MMFDVFLLRVTVCVCHAEYKGYTYLTYFSEFG